MRLPGPTCSIVPLLKMRSGSSSVMTNNDALSSNKGVFGCSGIRLLTVQSRKCKSAVWWHSESTRSEIVAKSELGNSEPHFSILSQLDIVDWSEFQRTRSEPKRLLNRFSKRRKKKKKTQFQEGPCSSSEMPFQSEPFRAQFQSIQTRPNSWVQNVHL